MKGVAKIEKIVFVLFACLVVMAGCGSVAQSSDSGRSKVSDQFKQDSEPIVNMLDTALEEDRPLNDSEKVQLQSFFDKYDPKDKSLNAAEHRAAQDVYFMSNSIHTDVESRYDPEFYKSMEKDLKYVIKKGVKAE